MLLRKMSLSVGILISAIVSTSAEQGVGGFACVKKEDFENIVNTPGLKAADVAADYMAKGRCRAIQAGEPLTVMDRQRFNTRHAIEGVQVKTIGGLLLWARADSIK